MAKVSFFENFDFYPLWPSKSVLIAYKAGQTYENVRREAADQAVAAGLAREDKGPRRRRSRSA